MCFRWGNKTLSICSSIFCTIHHVIPRFILCHLVIVPAFETAEKGRVPQLLQGGRLPVLGGPSSALLALGKTVAPRLPSGGVGIDFSFMVRKLNI